MIKQDINEVTFKELSHYFESTKERTFRAVQIFDWIYKKGATSFDEMKNIPKDLRDKLSAQFNLGAQNSKANQFKSSDGTIKYLFTLSDGEKIESVFIPAKNRNTLCVSTQVGCRYKCQFCASGLTGLKRNLTTSEIISQILFVNNKLRSTNNDQRLTHIVFMGVGEPLDNYDNLLKAIRLINAKEAFHIAARRITISTCGLVPQIKTFSEEGIQVELAISLHASNDELRNKIMPINKKYPLKELMACCRAYYKKTNRQITFEYLLIKDLTCSEKAVKELKNLLKGFDNKLNLIKYNEVKEFDYKAPSKKEILFFQKNLKEAGIHSILRAPRGPDIAAACGQLRIK